MRSVREAPISKETKVFVRCDIDVPIKNGDILNTYRLDRVLPTIKYIIEKGGFPVIAGHIDKPGGIYKEEISTKNLLPYFESALGKGNFKLLENLRFNPGEEKNDIEYTKSLATEAEIYVNEAFATCHREHSSIVGVPLLLHPYAGLRLQEEIETLSKLNSAEKPFVVIIGGAKLESKMPVIEKFLETADYVILSGLLSYNWSKKIPHNLILADDYKEGDKDITPETASKYIEFINNARSVLWAGPVGVYEEEEFIVGTRKLAEAITTRTKNGDLYSVIGGGDSIAAITKLNLLDKFSFVSTGGSAMLNYLASETLPGIEALNYE